METNVRSREVRPLVARPLVARPLVARPPSRPVLARRAAAVALLIGIVLGLLVPKIFAADSNSSPSGTTIVHVVSNGETIWQLAQVAGFKGDRRHFVADVQSLNRLESAQVFAGQRLLLPRS